MTSRNCGLYLNRSLHRQAFSNTAYAWPPPPMTMTSFIEDPLLIVPYLSFSIFHLPLLLIAGLRMYLTWNNHFQILPFLPFAVTFLREYGGRDKGDSPTSSLIREILDLIKSYFFFLWNKLTRRKPSCSWNQSYKSNLF